MKKFISYLLLFILGSMNLSVFAQEDFEDWVDSLLGEESFGYSSSDQIEVVSISSSSVEIESPVVQDEAGFDILDYAILYGKYPIAEAMENPDLLDNFGEKEISLDEDPGDNFTLELDSDLLDSDSIYYALILPKDEFGLPGEISNDICFNLDNKIYGQGTECDDAGGLHAAGGANMNLANITHAIDDDTITLRWTALEGADKIDLFVRDPRDERFEELSTVDMSDEEYSFKTDRNGEHNIKFIPMDGSTVAGTEVIYTLTVNTLPQQEEPEPDTPTTTGITQVPVVGSKENIVLIVVVSMFVYFVYRVVARRKS